jgi:hypothetical protein
MNGKDLQFIMFYLEKTRFLTGSNIDGIRKIFSKLLKKEPLERVERFLTMQMCEVLKGYMPFDDFEKEDMIELGISSAIERTLPYLNQVTAENDIEKYHEDANDLQYIIFYLRKIGFLTAGNIDEIRSIFSKTIKKEPLQEEERLLMMQICAALKNYLPCDNLQIKNVMEFGISNAIERSLPYLSQVSSKYDISEYHKVNAASSILATSLALNPTETIKTRPGDKYVRICTYHQEKTASMYLYDRDNNNVACCYGCGMVKWIFEYLAMHLDISEDSALEILAKASGIEITSNFGTSDIEDEMVERIQGVLGSDYYLGLKEASKAKTEASDTFVPNIKDYSTTSTVDAPYTYVKKPKSHSIY